MKQFFKDAMYDYPTSCAFVFVGILVTAIFFVTRLVTVGSVGDVVDMTQDYSQSTGRTWVTVSCARWYEPGLHHSRLYLVKTSTGEDDQDEAARAEAYFNLLDKTNCEPSKTTTVKRITR